MQIRRGRTRSSAGLPRIEDLARKHRVEAAVLPAKLEELRSELAALEQSDLVLGGLDERIADIRRRYDAAAAALTAARRAAARKLATAVTGLMRQLGMPGGRFEIAVETDTGVGSAADGRRSHRVPREREPRRTAEGRRESRLRR